jgi:protein SCO1/2
MRTRSIIALAVLVGLAAGCRDAGTGARTYELKGQVLTVRAETKEILVKHEDIKGFMPAMTMPYTVNHDDELKGIAAGDLITATLVVETSRAYLQQIKKTGSAPLPEDARTTIPAAANVHILQAGDLVPNTPLTDQDGKSIRLSDFRGSAVALSFIYTRCPLPQYCPLIDRRFAEVQRMTANGLRAGTVKLLSISFDPAWDRPATLSAHAKRVGANPAVWTFATADEAVVDRMAATFGINVIREKDGTITHNLRTAVIDPSGRVRSILDNNEWTAFDLINSLNDAIAASR